MEETSAPGTYTDRKPELTMPARGAEPGGGNEVQEVWLDKLEAVCRLKPASGRVHFTHKAPGSGANSCTVEGSLA